MEKLLKRPALTLIEVIVAMSVGILIAGVMGNIFFDSWKAQISQQGYSELQQKSRRAVDEISSIIQSASGVMTAVTYNGNTYQSSASSIILRTPALDVNNAVLGGTDYIIFRRNPTDNSQLERIIIADNASARASLASPFVVINELALLEFHFYSADNTEIDPVTGDRTASGSVSVKVRAERFANNRTLSREIDNKVFLRNN